MYKYLFFVLLFAACTSSTVEDEKLTAPDSPSVIVETAKTDSNNFASSVQGKGDFTFKVIKGENGFGYDIYSGEKLSIHQPIIPGLPGNNGFKTETEAGKVAALVLHKLNNNIMPPSVTKEEMDSVLNLK